MPELFAPYTAQPADDVARELGVNPRLGLSSAEVAARGKRYGCNAVAGRAIRWWEVLARQFTSPFTYLLVAAALLSLFFRQYLDAALVMMFVGGNALLGFYQEFKSEQTLKLLSRFVQHRALVRREGGLAVIASAALVPGDVVVVENGDVIPADLRLCKANNLLVNESVLTGESAPVPKVARERRDATAQLHQAGNIGFSATAVVGGMGEGIVIATGSRTVAGGISQLTAGVAHVSSFEKGIAKFSRFILRVILLTLVFVFLANLAIKGGKADIRELLVFTIALAVSVIPEALPVVTTFCLSRGAYRLAKHKVVVKRLSAIEDLGSIDILCTDKTGTLTENQLTVDQVYRPDGALASGGEEEVLWYACLAASLEGVKKNQPNNAFDLALRHRISEAARHRLDRYVQLAQVPFDPQRRHNSVLVAGHHRTWRIERGALEEILTCCHHLSRQQQAGVAAWVQAAGREGRRVIAVAVKEITHPAGAVLLPDDAGGCTFLGAVSFLDPLKPSTASAVAKATALGIQVKILTGDSPEVATAVAKKIGLIASEAEVITGEVLDQLPLPQQRVAVAEHQVFARVTPQQKYKVIQILQERHEVGFLGEGINDAPALKVANVAIAVQDAADIAKDAADVILLKKSLQVIIDGVQEGREVFANTLKYIKATLASNFGNFYAIAVASLLIDFLPMLPLQILLVNLLSDFPTIAIATDAVDPQELAKPRTYDLREIAVLATMLGLVSTAFDFIFFAIFSRISPAVLQTNWFLGSILTELVFLFSIRTRSMFLAARRPSLPLVGMTTLAMALTVALPFSRFGQQVFHFVRPGGYSLVLIFAIVAVYFTLSESVKLLYYRTAAAGVKSGSFPPA